MIHIPGSIESRYGFITLAAERCKQLMRGAQPRLESHFNKPTTIALEEILAGLVEPSESSPDPAQEWAPEGQSAAEETPTVEPSVPPVAEAAGE